MVPHDRQGNRARIRAIRVLLLRWHYHRDGNVQRTNYNVKTRIGKNKGGRPHDQPTKERIREIWGKVPRLLNTVILKQLRRFLGMTSWYRKFLPDFATIDGPLTRLTRKNFKYLWEEEQQRTFKPIKVLVALALVLHRPDSNSRFGSGIVPGARRPGTSPGIREPSAYSGRAELFGHRKRIPFRFVGDREVSDIQFTLPYPNRSSREVGLQASNAQLRRKASKRVS